MKNELPESLVELLQDQTPPCVSIYMPTLRAKPPARQNPVRLANLVRDAISRIQRAYRHAQVADLLDKLNALAGNSDLWRHPTDGLAAFVSSETSRTLNLQRTVSESVHVGDSFHLKPLIRTLQLPGGFHLLCLRLDSVRIYEGDRHGLRQLPPHNIPTSIDDALGRLAPGQPAEPHFNRISGAEDRERFLRMVDRAVFERCSRPSALPLVLCAIEQYHGILRHISQNPFLLPNGIMLDPGPLDERRLHQEAMRVIEPFYQQRTQKLVEQYQWARAHGQGSDDLVQVAKAMTGARVATLLVDADKHVAGRFDPANGKLEFGDSDSAHWQDVLDDIAECAIRAGGQVLVLPPEQMPTQSGLAAIYRF